MEISSGDVWRRPRRYLQYGMWAMTQGQGSKITVSWNKIQAEIIVRDLKGENISRAILS